MDGVTAQAERAVVSARGRAAARRPDRDHVVAHQPLPVGVPGRAVPVAAAGDRAGRPGVRPGPHARPTVRPPLAVLSRKRSVRHRLVVSGWARAFHGLAGKDGARWIFRPGWRTWW